jgi:ketosteroid isomerase-like protein
MKKISILTVITCALGFGLVTIFTDSAAQSAEKVKKKIEETNRNFVRWFNNGQLDSVVSIYDKDACLVGNACGENAIRSQYAAQMLSGQKFKSLETLSVTVEKNTAVEKGRFIVDIHSQELSGEFVTEWKYIDKKWRIVSDIANVTNLKAPENN